MVYWIFQNCAPWSIKAFYSNGSKVKRNVYQDWFITSNDHQFFQESRYSKTWKHFHFIIIFFLFCVCTGIYSLFKSINKIQNDKNVRSINSFISCKCWHQKKVYISQEMHSRMKAFINKSKKTALSWSFISTLLMTIDKFFEFNWICIDLRLNLVFEGGAKLLVEETISLLHVDIFWPSRRVFP